MGRYLIQRMLLMLPTLFLISVVTFVIIQLPPGDFLTTLISDLEASGERADLQKVEFLRQQFGLDQPLWKQYWLWVSGLVQGDLGYSFEYDRPVSDIIGERLLLTFVVSFGVDPLHLADGVSDRRLLGDPPVQLGRPRAHAPRLPRPGDAELPARADPDVHLLHLLRDERGRASSRRTCRTPPWSWARVVGPAPAPVDPGDRHRDVGHGRHDPPAAREPAGRAPPALRGHRPGQGPGPAAHPAQVPAPDRAQPLHRRHRQPAAAGHLGRDHRLDRAVPPDHRAHPPARAPGAGHVPGRLVPDAPGDAHGDRRLPLGPRPGGAGPAHPPGQRASR